MAGLGDSMVFGSHMIFVVPFVLLFFLAILPIFLKVMNSNRELSPNLLVTLLSLGVVGFGFLHLILSAGLPSTGEGLSLFYGAFVFDRATSLVLAVFSLLFAGCLWIYKKHVQTAEEQLSEGLFLLVSSFLGVSILVSARDLMSIFIGFEVMSLPLYLLIALSKETKLSKEAAFKYFILGSFASAILLYGMALVFGLSGTTSLETLAEQGSVLIGQNRLFLMGSLLLFCGFAFKVGLFPFHAWTPDVYTGASSALTSYMATIVKTASLVAFLRWMGTQNFLGYEHILTFLSWIAVLTMFVGNAGAILQTQVKRILAYSSIAHSGYAFMGLIVVATSAEHVAFATSSVLFYMIGYSVVTLGAFGLISYLETKENSTLLIEDLSGLSGRHPWIAFLMSLFLLSLAGIPPLLGFAGKLFLFSSVLAQGYYWMVGFALLNSVLAMYYYLRPIVVMYMVPSQVEIGFLSGVRKSQAIIFLVYCCAILTISLGLFAGFGFHLLDAATRASFFR